MPITKMARKTLSLSVRDLRKGLAEVGEVAATASLGEQSQAFAVQAAGLATLNEGQKVEYELVADRRSGKMSADNLKAVG